MTQVDSRRHTRRGEHRAFVGIEHPGVEIDVGVEPPERVG